MKPPLEKIAEDDGLSIDATFSLAGHSPISVTLESGGGGRNLHYSRGLHLLLQRLSQAQATLLRAALTSSRVTGHQEEGIELELEDYSYPIDIASIQVEELRRALQRALARTGRTPDRDGPGGNPTKRITLDVRFPTILDYDVATFLRTGKTARQKFIPRLAIGSTMNSQYLHLLSSLDQSGSRGMADYLGRLIASLVSKRFVILSGLSGSGKTQLARLIAGWMGGLNSLARVDPFAPNSTIQGQSITYLVKNSDALSIEVWNSPDESDAVRVLLPRSLIREWADCIVEKSFDRDVSSSDIRSAVQQESRWSGQLHSFHAPLKAAAFALLEAESGYGPPTALLVPVGADWTGNENLLGYPDGIDAQVYRSTPILDFVLRACDDPDRPYFLILDEMNLSHVERYFADFLSAMESGEGMIPLYQGQDRKADRDIPQTLHLPRNLFVIGTVNVDETTYMFSPKVLDRAN
ncbi:MAG: hypothetical protein K8H99_05520, partial [Nitrospirae bacterium]|nr:hypothetical protein [Fimbriimonadaceae bacterium]